VKVSFQSKERLKLEGIPGGLSWLLFASALGLLITVVSGTLALQHFREEGIGVGVIMCGLGAALGQVFFWTGALTIAIGRESLELDKAASGRGKYRSRSPVVTRPKPFDFDLMDIQSVTLERFSERHRGGNGRGGSSQVEIYRCRLLVRNPRRAVTLDETSNQQDERVKALAKRVADFLGIPVEETNQQPH